MSNDFAWCLDSWRRQNMPHCRGAGVIVSSRVFCTRVPSPRKQRTRASCSCAALSLTELLYMVSCTFYLIRYILFPIRRWNGAPCTVCVWLCVYARTLRPALREVDEHDACAKLQDRRGVCPLFFSPPICRSSPCLPCTRYKGFRCCTMLFVLYSRRPAEISLLRLVQ